MKYKVGDKVRIKSKEWFDSQEKKENGSVILKDGWYFSFKMYEYCGRFAIIVKEEETYYDIDIDNCEWAWTDEMFEDETEQNQIELQMSERAIDWEERRYELAKAAMNSLTTAIDWDFGSKSFEECLCSRSIKIADEMVKQLKNK